MVPLVDRLRSGAPAAPGADRLGLLPSGPDPVHGAPPRRTQPSTPIFERVPSGGGPQEGNSAPHREGFGYRAPLTPRLARSLGAMVAVAEGAGFEPARRDYRLHAFQACALGRTMRSLQTLSVSVVADPPFEEAMRLALEQAALAAGEGEVPVGCGPPRLRRQPGGRRSQPSPPVEGSTAHAEMLLLSSVARDRSQGRLEGHTLVVTLEPCAMCAGAAVLARLDRIVYGTPDLKAGACWSLYNIPQDRRLNHHIDLVAGVLEAECAELLSGFFAERRADPGPTGA